MRTAVVGTTLVALLSSACASSVSGRGATQQPSSPPSPSPTSSAPATVTVTASPTSAGSPTSSVAATPPSVFVGTFFGHGRSLVITAAGAVTITYRTYVSCTPTRTTGCDRTQGNEIIDGGLVSGHVSQVVDDTTMMVTVTSSSVPSDVPLGAVRFGYDTTNHAVALFAGGFSGVPFCGAAAPVGYCGA